MTSAVELGRSPGGKEENTGNASKFSDKLMIGIVDMISTIPVKFARPSKGPALDSLAARPLPGTDRAYEPFWSPDGCFIAFFADRKLKKIGGSGGPVLNLCDIAVAAGISILLTLRGG